MFYLRKKISYTVDSKDQGGVFLLRDRLILVLIVSAVLSFLILQFDLRGEYPFLAAVLVVFSFSAVAFIAFMNHLSMKWFIRFWTVNFVLSVLLLLIEGIEFLWLSLIMWLLLAGAQISVYLLRGNSTL